MQLFLPLDVRATHTHSTVNSFSVGCGCNSIRYRWCVVGTKKDKYVVCALTKIDAIQCFLYSTCATYWMILLLPLPLQLMLVDVCVCVCFCSTFFGWRIRLEPFIPFCNSYITQTQTNLRNAVHTVSYCRRCCCCYCCCHHKSVYLYLIRFIQFIYRLIG